jgi:glutamyl-tRNA reductase
VVPTVTALRQRFELIREMEFDKPLESMSQLSEKDRDKIKLMAAAMVRCLLRRPTDAIKEEPDPGRRLDRAETARHLFGLDLESKDKGGS